MPTEDYQENEFVLMACWRVWKIVHLFHKPKTTGSGKTLKNNWTPEDVDLAAFLSDNAWNGWVQHLKDADDGEPA